MRNGFFDAGEVLTFDALRLQQVFNTIIRNEFSTLAEQEVHSHADVCRTQSSVGRARARVSEDIQSGIVSKIFLPVFLSIT